MATYSERPEDWENNLERLRRKFDTARELSLRRSSTRPKARDRDHQRRLEPSGHRRGARPAAGGKASRRLPAAAGVADQRHGPRVHEKYTGLRGREQL
jgi:hypothetical protein